MLQTTILVHDGRKPLAGYATYAPGIDLPDPARPMGPNTLREGLFPVAVERHDDKTRVGFSYIAPRPKSDGTLEAYWVNPNDALPAQG